MSDQDDGGSGRRLLRLSADPLIVAAIAITTSPIHLRPLGRLPGLSTQRHAFHLHLSVSAVPVPIISLRLRFGERPGCKPFSFSDSRTVFTALHAMQTRSSDEKAVRLSVHVHLYKKTNAKKLALAIKYEFNKRNFIVRSLFNYV